MASLKGPGETLTFDGSSLRIAIVHARWNTAIISALVAGARKSLIKSGVKEENIVVQDVPGSYELPYAVQRLYTASQIQSSTSTDTSTPSATDLLTSTSVTDLTSTTASTDALKASNSSFDAIIAIGVLIKGETMHFEYIADATSHGLMRVQLDSGVPVVFGLLTVLNEQQAMARAGMQDGSHCHGEDWGAAAVELGVKRRMWGQGKMQ
ncbi:MAG: hypothetical protein L6R41_003283 [Letrouitia leprolyta]|nr:MAG: hypothetical protein L6R41_003283 [Letrouitia leprolyta]